MTATDPFLFQALAAALLAFIPQTFVLWGVAAAGLALLRRAAPEVRYAVTLLALGCCLALFGLTFWGVLRAGPMMAATAAPYDGAGAWPPPLAWAEAALSAPGALADFLPPEWTAALLILWTLGATATGVRFGWAWLAMTHRLRREARPLGLEWTALAARQLRELGLSTRVRLVSWSGARAPFMLGWLRPVIVFPTATLTGLPRDQVELLLLHELIHVRRADALVNQLQLVAEAVFFFHPGVRWLSRRIRVERELCCDEAVCRISGHPRRYVEALAHTALQGAPAHDRALAASGGDLATRIRLLLVPRRPARSSLQAAGAVAMLLLLTLGGSSLLSRARELPGADLDLIGGIEPGPFVALESHSRRTSFGRLAWRTFACPDSARLTSFSLHSGRYALRIVARGELASDPGMLAVTGSARRATLVIEERRGAAARRFVMRRAESSAPSWSVASARGPEHAASSHERAHATRLLEGLWARTSFLAAERARRAVAQDGRALDHTLDGVRDDFARAEMLIAAFSMPGLDLATQRSLIRLAGTRVRSSVELGRVLRTLANSHALAASNWDEWLCALRGADASVDRERALTEAATVLPTEWSHAFLSEVGRLPAERRDAVLRSWNQEARDHAR